MEANLLSLQKDLMDGNYKNSVYRIYSMYEPKLRLIYVLPYYPDRIVHHAIMNVLEPIWDSLFIYDSYACRKGKGQHKGMIKCSEYVRKYRYCAKLDISQFYVNIDHEILKIILRKKIKDKDLLSILDTIIDSLATREANIGYLKNFEGRKDADIMRGKLERYVEEFGHRKAGVPIGNYLSQWFGNLYMNELDTYIKYDLKCSAYIRYCDDFIIFGNNKKELHEVAEKAKVFAYDKLNLLLSKSNVFPITQGVDFLGYRTFPNNCVLLRKSTAKRIKRRFRKLDSLLKTADLDLDYARGMVASTEGWMKWANTYNFRKSIKLDSVKERIELLMRGIPKVLSSKEDYYYMAENFNEEVWKPLWGNLLFDDYIWIYAGEVEKAGKNTDTVKYETMEENGKTTILKYEYVENPQSLYKSLGFTKDEIAKKLGA